MSRNECFLTQNSHFQAHFLSSIPTSVHPSPSWQFSPRNEGFLYREICTEIFTASEISAWNFASKVTGWERFDGECWGREATKGAVLGENLVQSSTFLIFPTLLSVPRSYKRDHQTIALRKRAKEETIFKYLQIVSWRKFILSQSSDSITLHFI